MKSFTDILQSKKLAKILPIESADMRYGYIAPYDYSDRMYEGGYDDIPYPKDFLKKNPNFSENEYDEELPAWSLAALLGLMPITCILSISNGHYRIASNETNTFFHNNPLDAAFEMVCWLKENKKI